MKPVLAWIRSNLSTTIAGVIAVAAFPALFIISSGGSKKLHAQVEQEVGANLRDLNSISVNYTAPSLDPAKPAVSLTRVPNLATTAAIGNWLILLKDEADRLVELAIEANNPDRTVLISGLFPEPEASESISKRLQMARSWPQANSQLLDEAGAGTPPDPALVFDQIERKYQNERRRLLGATADESAALRPEEEMELRKTLGQDRLAIYKGRADAILFYAAPEVIFGVTPWDETKGAPELERCWEWQLRLWVTESVLRGLVMANTDEAGQKLSAIFGPVKRIESIVVSPWDLPGAARDAKAPPATVSLTGEILRDFEISPTGRTAWPATQNQQNPMYDIRYVDLSLIVDSSRLPQIIEGFPRAGLLSVVDLSVEPYNPIPDFEQGYFYGAASLMRARMRVETLWLREWMAPLMPATVRGVLGVPDAWATPTADELQPAAEAATPAAE